MKFITIIFSVIVLGNLSCRTNKSFEKIQSQVSKEKKITLTIPKGYTFYKVGWESKDESFVYNDSSFIFVSDQGGGGVNYDNIKNAGKLDTLFYIQSLKDTLILSGVDKNGLYWKNSYYGQFSIGYKNVRQNKKKIFDTSVDSFKIK